jgi:SAM-dependent methyltransferase
MRNIIKFLLNLFVSIFFDPRQILKKWRGLPIFINNLIKYRKNNNDRFKISLVNIYPMLTDRFESAGEAIGHYFFQDLWASEYIYNNKIKSIVDIGSRIDGYIAHILPFCEVTYIDIREIYPFHKNFKFKIGSVLNLPFEGNSVKYLSCLHVIEHIGLGRYGDTLDPEGHIKAAKELIRVLKPGGILLLGTPIGKEKLCFDSHRIFDPHTINKIFEPLKLNKFSYIDDMGKKIIFDATFEQARECSYGCGLFEFNKLKK